MYDILLQTHSWLRWLVLILAVVVIFLSYLGWFGNRKYSKLDNALGGSFIGTLHLQLLIGLLLYFVFSPVGIAAFQNGVGTVMKNGALRYYAVEHIFTMIVGVVVAQIGRTRSKKASGKKKFSTAAIFYTIAIILIASRIPWDKV